MKVKIYKPAKNAMQSGLRNTRQWLIEFEQKDRKYIEPLMGWTGSDDTLQQLRMYFETMEKAVKFAESKGFEYVIEAPQKRRIIKKSYADNFAYKPPIA